MKDVCKWGLISTMSVSLFGTTVFARSSSSSRSGGSSSRSSSFSRSTPSRSTTPKPSRSTPAPSSPSRPSVSTSPRPTTTRSTTPPTSTPTASTTRRTGTIASGVAVGTVASSTQAQSSWSKPRGNTNQQVPYAALPSSRQSLQARARAGIQPSESAVAARGKPRTSVTVGESRLSGQLKNSKSGDRHYRRVADTHVRQDKYLSRSDGFGPYHPKLGYRNYGYRQAPAYRDTSAPSVIYRDSGLGFFETYLYFSLLNNMVNGSNNSGATQVTNNYYGDDGSDVYQDPQYLAMQQRFVASSDVSKWTTAANSSSPSLFKVPDDMSIGSCDIKYGGDLLLESIKDGFAQVYYLSPNIKSENDQLIEGECEQYQLVSIPTVQLAGFNSQFIAAANEVVDANQDRLADQFGGSIFDELQVETRKSDALVICSGTVGKNYDKAAIKLQQLLAGSVGDVEIINTAGSWENLEKINAGICDVAFVQSDAPDLHEAGVEGSHVASTRFATRHNLYPELAHLVCRTDLNVSTMDELIAHSQETRVSVAIGGIGSGAAITWAQIERAKGSNMQSIAAMTLGGDAAKAALFDGKVDCLFDIVGRNSELMVDLSNVSKNQNQSLKLISLSSNGMSDAYSEDQIGNDTYPGLYTRGVFDYAIDSSPTVLAVQAQIMVSNALGNDKAKEITNLISGDNGLKNYMLQQVEGH